MPKPQARQTPDIIVPTGRAVKRYLDGEFYCKASPCCEMSRPSRSCSRDTLSSTKALTGFSSTYVAAPDHTRAASLHDTIVAPSVFPQRDMILLIARLAPLPDATEWR